MKQPEKHDNYLDCLADISNQLFSAPDPWSAVPVIVDWIREITKAQRCYLTELRRTEDHRWHGLVRFEALAPGDLVHGRGEEADWAGGPATPAWLAALASGNEVQGRVNDLAADGVPGCSYPGAEWVVNLPLLVDGELVGGIGLDFVGTGNQPDGQDIALLRATANAISTALDRLASERRLREAHALLSTILKSTGDLTLIATDLKLRVMHYSPCAENLFGYTEQEVIGCYLDELNIIELPGGDLTSNFLSALLDEGPVSLESEVRDPQGEYRTVAVVVSGMFDSRRSPIGYLITVRDVTEDRRQQRRTLQSQRMESVGMLAGGVAHDFNNILMGILGYTSLAKDALDKAHPAYRMLNTIEQSGERAAGLTNELLAYARGGKYRSVAVRIDEQVDELLNILATNLPRGIAIRKDYAKDLPFVLADPVQMQQVIMNICLNAGDAIREKATGLPDEEYTGEISFATRLRGLSLDYLAANDAEEVEPGKFIELTIRDNGCGMDAETQARIFEPFFTTKFTGRGLGLAAVDGIIRNHGGLMTVESEPGVGTCFTIYLPVTKVFDRPQREEQALVLTGAETILFVDDEDVIRQLALLNLTNLGYKVLLAGTGQEAIEVYREHHGEIAMTVLDMVMPGLSGEATIHELRRIDANGVILLTSGYDETTARGMGDYTGIAAFLQKPYTPEALSRAVRKTLNQQVRPTGANPGQPPETAR